MNLNLDKIFLPLLKILPCYQAFLAEVSITLVVSGHWRFNRWLWPLKGGKLSPRGSRGMPPEKKWNLEARKCDFQRSEHQKACRWCVFLLTTKQDFFDKLLIFWCRKVHSQYLSRQISLSDTWYLLRQYKFLRSPFLKQVQLLCSSFKRTNMATMRFLTLQKKMQWNKLLVITAPRSFSS